MAALSSRSVAIRPSSSPVSFSQVSSSASSAASSASSSTTTSSSSSFPLTSERSDLVKANELYVLEEYEAAVEFYTRHIESLPKCVAGRIGRAQNSKKLDLLDASLGDLSIGLRELAQRSETHETKLHYTMKIYELAGDVLFRMQAYTHSFNTYNLARKSGSKNVGKGLTQVNRKILELHATKKAETPIG